jgi:hypothetical protein
MPAMPPPAGERTVHLHSRHTSIERGGFCRLFLWEQESKSWAERILRLKPL